MTLLDGKIALVTGGSKGIGSAIVRRLAQQGSHVAFTYLSSPESAQKLASEITDYGVKAIAYRCDVSKFAEAEKLVTDVLADFGGLDIVVNNAGITKDNLLLRMTEEQWDAVMSTNLKSMYNVCKPAIKHLMRKGGSIINISSVVGVFGNAGQTNYAASKAAIFGFTKSLAKEMGSRNVRVNAIAPGYIETEMTAVLDEKVKEGFLSGIPLKRMGQAKEVADTVVFLASDMATYITGQTLSVCGGLNC